jgi:hypothetical protein
MATSDELLIKLIEALGAEGCGGEGLNELEVRNIEHINKLRRVRDRAIRDREAAALLPQGWRVVAERFGGVCKATVYNMNQRAQEQAALERRAMESKGAQPA